VGYQIDAVQTYDMCSSLGDKLDTRVMDALTRAMDVFRQGNVREAELICERRLAGDPDDAECYALLAEIHLATGRNPRAADLLTRLTQLRPRDASAHRRLAGVLLSLDRAEQATAVLRTAIGIEPNSTRAHNNLGQGLMRLGQIEAAKASFQEALRLDSRYAIGHNNLGLAYTESAEFERATESFHRALALDPTLVIAQLNLAIALEKAGHLAEALQGYEAVLQRTSEIAEAWVGRGSVLDQQRRFEDALACFDKALSLRPGDAGAHHARAEALRKLGRKFEALQSLETALRLNPDDVQTWCNIGLVQHELGRFESALDSYRRALELDPNNIQARTRLLARLIPSVPLTQEQALGARAAFETQLLEFEAWLSTRILSESDALTVAQQQFFYLSYEEISNTRLLERYRGACVNRLASFKRPSHATVRTTEPVRRFKLGLVSAHVHDHSVYNAILRGWLQCLDRGQFDISLFSIGAKQDAMTQEARNSVEHFKAGSRTTSEWADEIHGRQFDALIFPEIGMNETTLALASLRLASRQFAAWGHPETSGLRTIDGYLSAELFEPADAQDHYTERLLRLPNLGVHCQPYGTVPTQVDLETLGIHCDGTRFICPGVPFKYRPQDDRILVEIARRVERCTFIFFEYEVVELSHKLRTRIAAAFHNAGLDPARYLVWIPWQPREAFFGLLGQCDVYLDTIGFSGFNTLMQAVECHLPCVTYEGRFMRGRLGSGIVKRLGLPELAALDREQYISTAVRLASSNHYRAELRDKMRPSEAGAYADSGAVDALASVLLETRESFSGQRPA
jgi:protein O-GlcNAc transferase